jgi:hypothetical protein
MFRRVLILLLLIVSLNQVCYPQKVSNDDRLREIVREYKQAEVSIPLTGNIDFDKLTRNSSILSVKDKIVHISLSPLTVEWFILQKYNYEIQKYTGTKGIVTAADLTQAMEWDKYPTYSQYDSIMRSFVNIYPALCHLDTIGTSINGKLVLAVKISDNAGSDEDEPEVFYSSSIHGDETGGYILMLRLVDYLVKNYTLDAKVKNLVDNLEIWINPLANPDGTYGTGNIISSPTRFNANGKDLNRNFPDPFQPSEIQQKENVDMIKFLRNHKFVISANFHSGSEVVNYPWDRWLTKIHADNAWFNSISRSYADTVHVYSGPSYLNELDNGVTRGSVWYIIYGGRQDFVTWELQGREVTIELDDQFITPAAQLSLLWQYNWHSLTGYLENALYGIHGVVQNTVTQAPVHAKIFIEGHDKDSSHVYSDALSGSFVRLLAPGSWNLTFSAAGYQNLTMNNVIVTQGQKTDIIVKMATLLDSVDPVKKEIPLLYPNPATARTVAVLPPGIEGKVNIRIISLSGRIMAGYLTEVMSGVPLEIDLTRLSSGIYIVVFQTAGTESIYRSRVMVIK